MRTTLRIISSIFATIAFTTLLGCAGAGEKTGMVVDDTVITTKVKAEILENQKLKVFDIHVDTHDGVVQLSGFADNPAEAEKATAAARSVHGVKEVHNDMRMKQ